MGRRYLIQHSAGSGKSNSIAWLAHQLIGLARDGAPKSSTRSSWLPIGASSTSRSGTRSSSMPKSARRWATRSAPATCVASSTSGKKIIISTVQKFPFILDEIGNEQRGRRFAIIIDEAHSSQGGRTSAAMAQALSEAGAEGEEETFEDQINRLMESHKLLPNASYFAFTATPKNKTLEIFGEPEAQSDGAGQASRLPQLHHEAGDPGGLHPGRAGALHAGDELLQARQDDRGRPGVRREQGTEEAAPVRRGPRPRDPPQGRDHGGPLPRTGVGQEQDRRPGAGDGGHQRDRARDPVLPRHPRLPDGAEEPIPSDRRLLRRARSSATRR